MSSKIFSVFRSDLFKGKVAVVTGGGTGIGKAISLELLYLGCKVVIASRKQERLLLATEEMKNALKEKCPDISSIECNIRKEDEVQNLIQSTLEKHGRIDYLVNNGGGQFLSPASDISVKGWDAVIETNLKGPFLMCRAVFDKWMKDNGGVIINILMDFERGVPMMAHSGAARSGLDNLTKSLAIEWASNGIRVNAVAPGSSIYSETAAKNYPVDVFSMVKENIPSRRVGLPEEISSAVCYLLSPGASFITGETLHVDAGGRLYSPLMWNVPGDKVVAVAISLLRQCGFSINKNVTVKNLKGYPSFFAKGIVDDHIQSIGEQDHENLPPFSGEKSKL